MFDAGRFTLVLADIDLISKLAQWRLLHCLPEIYSCSITQIATLPSLAHRAYKEIANNGKLFKDTDTAQYAYDFLVKLPEPPPPDGLIMSELQTHTGIDYGEALLIATAAVHDNSLFATGDKRAITKLGELRKEGKYARICGKLTCLEQILACMHKLLGFEAMQACIRISPDADRSAKAIWGSRLDSPEESVCEGLASYTDSIVALAVDLMIETPRLTVTASVQTASIKP